MKKKGETNAEETEVAGEVYNFPEHSVSVRASSMEEALEKLKELQKPITPTQDE